VVGKQAANQTFGGLGARLIIAGVLDELRADPESFARILVAVSHVREADAAEVARLVAAAGAAMGPTDAPRAPR
jgi:hypothetical protein